MGGHKHIKGDRSVYSKEKAEALEAAGYVEILETFERKQKDLVTKDEVEPDVEKEVSWSDLRSQAATIAREQDVEPENYKKDTLLKFVAKHNG